MIIQNQWINNYVHITSSMKSKKHKYRNVHSVCIRIVDVVTRLVVQFGSFREGVGELDVMVVVGGGGCTCSTVIECEYLVGGSHRLLLTFPLPYSFHFLKSPFSLLFLPFNGKGDAPTSTHQIFFSLSWFSRLYNYLITANE